MRTFKITLAIEGKITIPDALLAELRTMAAEEPADGGDAYLHTLHKATYEDDDSFLQGALKNTLRNIARHGIVSDIGGLGKGVGVRCAPPTVTVSVPESVITKVKAREQISSGNIPLNSFGLEGALEQADT